MDIKERTRLKEKIVFELGALKKDIASLKEQANSMFHCEECDHKDYAVPIFVKYDPESGEVDDAEPEGGWDTYDIFDAQLVLRTQKSTDDAPPRIVIDRWEIKPPDKRLFDPKYQMEGDDAEQAKKTAEYNAKCLPLDMIHAPDDPATQAKILNLPNIFAAVDS